jgi:uncharacterized protein YyaL (SSP411 family)
LLELYQTDFNNHWFVEARELCDEMISIFSDPAGGFFDTPNDGQPLLFRPKEIQDNATPSGNAMACEALLKLADYTGSEDYRMLAEKGLQLAGDAALHYPTAFGRWLSAADYALDNIKQIAILYESGDEKAKSFLEAISAKFRSNSITAASVYPPPEEAPEILMGRPLIDGKVTAYVCENFICKLPVVGSVEELMKQI